MRYTLFFLALVLWSLAAVATTAAQDSAEISHELVADDVSSSPTSPASPSPSPSLPVATSDSVGQSLEQGSASTEQVTGGATTRLVNPTSPTPSSPAKGPAARSSTRRSTPTPKSILLPIFPSLLPLTASPSPSPITVVSLLPKPMPSPTTVVVVYCDELSVWQRLGRFIFWPISDPCQKRLVPLPEPTPESCDRGWFGWIRAWWNTCKTVDDPTPEPSPASSATPDPPSSPIAKPSPEPSYSAGDKIRFQLDLGAKNSDVAFTNSHRATLYIYDNDQTPRLVRKLSSKHVKRDSSGQWYVEFHPFEVTSNRITLPAGYYCVELELQFKLGSPTYRDYKAGTYVGFSDRMADRGLVGLFYHSEGGDQTVYGMEFHEPNGQRSRFCPTNAVGR